MDIRMSSKRKTRVFGNERFVYARAQFSRFRGSKINEVDVKKASQTSMKKRARDTQKTTKNEFRKTVDNCMKKGDAGHAGDA